MANKDLFISGRYIIEYSGKRCHFSSRGYSYAIRYFQNGVFVELDRGCSDKEKYDVLKSRIKVIQKAPRESLDNLVFWGEFFQAKHNLK
ncbi:MAG: hypothetical protein HZA77_09250 [Candidatus Schekmanbacteria bacterium]|nr:hypothetical protein [Candidatus Schekmanbacteria bacterium]